MSQDDDEDVAESQEYITFEKWDDSKKANPDAIDTLTKSLIRSLGVSKDKMKEHIKDFNKPIMVQKAKPIFKSHTTNLN